MVLTSEPSLPSLLISIFFSGDRASLSISGWPETYIDQYDFKLPEIHFPLFLQCGITGMSYDTWLGIVFFAAQNSAYRHSLNVARATTFLSNKRRIMIKI